MVSTSSFVQLPSCHRQNCRCKLNHRTEASHVAH
jgi:hypothetical protein